MVRQITDDVISAVEDGFLSWESVARACLSYMSEDEVADLVKSEDWSIADDDDLDDTDEDDNNDVVYYCFDFNDDIIDEFTDQDDAIDFAESDLGITRVVRYVGDNPDGEVWRRDDEEVLAEAINTSESEDELEALSRFKKGEVLFINNNDGYTAIVPRNKLDDEEAYISIDYDLGQELIDRYDLKLLDRESPNYNQEIYVYDEDDDFLTEDIEEEEFKDELLRNDYRKIDFYGEGILVGDIDLEVKDVEVTDMYDNDKLIDFNYTVRSTPDTIFDFICGENDINKEELTVRKAQELIDELVINPTPYYDFLEILYADEISDEAQYYIMEN